MLFSKKPQSMDADNASTDRRILESVVLEAFSEQRKARRWGVFFKSLTFLYLFVILLLFYPSFKGSMGQASMQEEHTAVVRVHGVIAAEEEASAGRIIQGLNTAFENEAAKAVILAINSPGGSPVQAGYVYDEIRRLKEKYPAKPVYSVVADVGASGGYYIAVAADDIYANRSSLVGSIGVTASGFGFVDALEKLGVERRHYTAGKHKAFLDPFSPVNEEEVDFWQGVLQSTHEQFIAVVREGRGDRIQWNEQITSGLVWNGEQALELGLIDGLGGVRYVAREVVGAEELRDYTPREAPLKMILEDLGIAMGKGIATFIQEQSFKLDLN